MHQNGRKFQQHVLAVSTGIFLRQRVIQRVGRGSGQELRVVVNPYFSLVSLFLLCAAGALFRVFDRCEDINLLCGLTAVNV